MKPTQDQYAAFVSAFDHFNGVLFDGVLEQPVLTFSRRKMVNGMFIPESWRSTGKGSKVDEISLNPDQLSEREPIAVASTLVHEMCHQFQQHHGTPSRRSYHNQEFAAIMEARGLRTSHDGTPNGRRTGQRMTHVIIPDGPFELAFADVAGEDFLPFICLTWEDWATRRQVDRSKTKYTTPGGDRGFWGAPGLAVVDAESGELFSEPEGDDVAADVVGPCKLALFGWVAGLEEEECRRVLEQVAS